MRRADRLFDIIQSLRAAPRPLTAASLAEELEVTPRTIYRDVASLQASRVPIEGAPGIGYVLRRGFDLPPLMFTSDEIDAIAVGARHVRRLRDPKLAAGGRERACQGDGDRARDLTIPSPHAAIFCIGGQRAAADRGGSRRHPQRDPSS